MPGGARLVDGDGSTVVSYTNAGAEHAPTRGRMLNLADYSSIGDITGSGTPAVLKGGLTPQRRRQPAGGQPEPAVHPPRAGLGRRLPAPRCPATRAPPTTSSSSRRARSPASAAAGPAGQVLVGTGLYQVHAYGPGGLEPAGWPKFTGGWNQVTPAVGDADGDGDLDVASLTREGWSFLWDTGTPACGGSNDEWWTFHHDEHGTANYGHDGRPPGAPTGPDRRAAPPTARRSPGPRPGDDWLCGRAARFQVLVSANPIEHPSDGAVVLGADAAAPPAPARRPR